MVEIKLHNTLTRSKVPFVPLDPDNVRMYVCGPTVYDRAHLGNARPVVVFDVLFRLLRHVYGPEHVTYVRNFTDVDDKIIARADESGVPIDEITASTVVPPSAISQPTSRRRRSCRRRSRTELDFAATTTGAAVGASTSTSVGTTEDDERAFASARACSALWRRKIWSFKSGGFTPPNSSSRQASSNGSGSNSGFSPAEVTQSFLRCSLAVASWRAASDSWHHVR